MVCNIFIIIEFLVSHDQIEVEKASCWERIEAIVSIVSKSAVLRADFVYTKGIEKFNCSALLGNFAK